LAGFSVGDADELLRAAEGALDGIEKVAMQAVFLE
jgi:hypothetical protein